MSKELSNIKEVKSRGADIVLFIKEALSGDLDTEYQVIKLRICRMNLWFYLHRLHYSF